MDHHHHHNPIGSGNVDPGGMIELTDTSATNPLVVVSSSFSSPDDKNNNDNSHHSSSSSTNSVASTSLDSHGMTTKGSASNRQVVINIIISFVGAGLLGIPYAYKQSGWALGSLALCTVSALNVYAMLLLPVVRQRLVVQQQWKQRQQQPNSTRISYRPRKQRQRQAKTTNRSGHTVLPQDDDDDDDEIGFEDVVENDGDDEDDTDQADGIMVRNKTNHTTGSNAANNNSNTVDGYGDVARLLMGQTGESIVNISLAISQTGFATAYIIFIAANLQKLAHISRGWTCILCIPGLSLLVQAADMRTLARSSLFANLANLLGLSSVLFVDVETLERPHPDDIDANRVHAVQWSGLLFVMAVTLYSMEGVGLVLSLEQSCREPLLFTKLLSRTVGSITLFMAVFGCAGYWAFAAHTQAPITLNLGTESTAASIVQSALCFALYLTYPVMMFPVWKIAQDKCLPSTNTAAHRVLLRIAVVCATSLVAYAVPNFGEFLSLVGSSLCTLLGFVFPCYFHQQVVGDERPMWQKGLDSFLLVGGALFGVVGTVQSLMSLLHGEDGDGQN